MWQYIIHYSIYCCMILEIFILSFSVLVLMLLVWQQEGHTTPPKPLWIVIAVNVSGVQVWV